MKKVIVSMAVASCLATSAMAGGNAVSETTARLDSLGLSNTQVSDFASIWSNPVNIVSMDNEVYMQSNGQSKAGRGGAVYDAGIGKIALFVARNSVYTISKNFGMTYYASPIFSLDPATSVAGASTAPSPINQMDLFYGKSLSKGLDLGLRVSYAGSAAGSVDTSTPTTSSSFTAKGSDLEIEVGADLKSMNLDVAVSVGLPNREERVSSTPATLNTFKSDALVLTSTVGHNLALKEGKNLRSVLYFSTQKLGSNATNGTTTETLTNNTMLIAASATLSKVKNDTTTYLSASVSNTSQTREFNNGVAAGATITSLKTNALSVPVVVAIENKTSKNWTVRGSATAYLFTYNTKNEDQSISSVDQGSYDIAQSVNTPAVFNFGAGYQNGNLTIDTVIAAGFTGANILANASAKLSAIYKF